ncbi:hypothetical protein IMSAG049_01684 [Clostridiales bacterium]|nr:hypothetical protein IMSAG049_01684 [Clostridiales bacterium]
MPAVALAVIFGFLISFDELEKGRAEEDMRQLEETLRRGCVACYAAEGSYPQDLEYLEKHYGIQIDKKRYTVRYDAFAQNLMPDITVLENEP